MLGRFAVSVGSGNLRFPEPLPYLVPDRRGSGSLYYTYFACYFLVPNMITKNKGLYRLVYNTRQIKEPLPYLVD